MEPLDKLTKTNAETSVMILYFYRSGLSTCIEKGQEMSPTVNMCKYHVMKKMSTDGYIKEFHRIYVLKFILLIKVHTQIIDHILYTCNPHSLLYNKHPFHIRPAIYVITGSYRFHVVPHGSTSSIGTPKARHCP